MLYSEDVMKRTLRIAVLIMCAVMMLCFASCGKDATETENQDLSKAPDAALVGYWKDPISTNPALSDVWSFEADGTYHLYQVAEDGKIKNAIDGTYSISGVELTVVMAGHSLKYDTYKVADDSLTLTDHGTETVLSKYTGKVNK